MLFITFKYFFSFRDLRVFEICKLANWWRHTLNQILIKHDEVRYLSQFVTEMFDSLQYDSNKCAPQYELKIFVTMATYWVPDLPNIKGFSGHLWRSILIFANGASYVWSSKHMNLLARVCGTIYCFLCSKSPTDWNKVGGDWERVSCHGNTILIVVGVFPLELLAYQVSMVCDANWPR